MMTQSKNNGVTPLRLLTTVTLFLTVVAWAVYAGYSAKTEAASGRAELREYRAQQNGTLKVIDTRLQQIDSRQIEIRLEQKEQRKMIEDLWRRSGGER